MRIAPLPTYVVSLVEEPPGSWSAEPLGLPVSRDPKELCCVSDSVVALVVDDVRERVADVLRMHADSFNLRFVDHDGAMLARSLVYEGAGGRHHFQGIATHLRVDLHEELRAKVANEGVAVAEEGSCG